MTNRGQHYSWNMEEREEHQKSSLTCRCACHDAECGHRLVADVVAVQQEASKVLHSVERTTENLLGPFTHQTTRSVADLLLDVGDWAWRIQSFKLDADNTEMLGLHSVCRACYQTVGKGWNRNTMKY